MNQPRTDGILSSNPPQEAPFTFFTFLNALSYIYLLRVQLITFIALVGFPFAALWLAPELLRGIFDVEPRGVVFVTLGAILASWTVMVTTWQIFLYGPERFQIQRFPLLPDASLQVPTRKGHSPIFALFALPTVCVAMYVSHSSGTASYLSLALGVLGGIALSVGILVAGGQFNKRTWFRALHTAKFLTLFGPGFKKSDGSANEGHYLSLWSFVLCLSVYVAIGIGKFIYIGGQPTVPTLADLLVFLMILCWGLAAVTFILDRWRIPVLLPFLFVATVTSHIPYSDHYFYTVAATPSPEIDPRSVIRRGKTGSTVILVAASGGGIKAAAWTARVLTGLEEDSRKNFSANPRVFGDSVRLVSAVSGGSVGAMYFVNAYATDGPGLPEETAQLEKVVEQAELSSLDDIAWGLVYPDFLRVFFPVFKHLDRGLALEAALTRDLSDSNHRPLPNHLSEPLSDLRAGVLEGKRPAIILNATVVESGERLLLGTTDLKPATGRTSLRNIAALASRDISLVTAARLSATFPYVSPAARADIPHPQLHVVDGGYTDNYGMATLLAWLDEALSVPDNPVRRVLIIEIRASPPAGEPTPRGQGWPFQSYAPIQAMLDVRDMGQRARNQEQLDIFKRLAGANCVDVEDAVFEYPAQQAPLSWHLSPDDRKEIQKYWDSADSRQIVHDFLAKTGAPTAKCP